MIRFGISFYQEDFTLEGMKKAWREAEDLGYDSLWVYDHFYPVTLNSNRSILEAWTLLPTLAAETSHVRLGIAVTCNSYRYPSVLAKIAATVDVISGGRLEFGLGAGWHKDEYKAYGIPFPKGKIRVEQLSESLEVIKRIWTQEKASFVGDHYTISDLVSYPKPVQKPYPPIWLGGKGNMMMRLVANYADNLIISYHSAEQFRQRLEVLRRCCADVGNDYEKIGKTLFSYVIITDDEKEALRQAKKRKLLFVNRDRREMGIQDCLERLIAGTPQQCINRIQEYVDVGVTYFIFNFTSVPPLEPLRIFMDRVASSFR